MREEKILHLRSLVLVLLMVTSYALPMLSPFEPEEEILVEDNQSMHTSTGPQLVVDVENKMGFGSSNIDRNHGFVNGPNGSAYIIGEFQGTLTFGTYSLTSSGSYFDGYVAKLNNQGNWEWAVKLGGTSTDRTYGLAVDSSGDAFVTGNFYGTCYFYDKTGQSSGSLTSAGSADLYVAKLKHDASDWHWMAKIGSSGTSEGGNDIVLDNWGDAYISGYIGDNSSIWDKGNSYWNSSYTNGGQDAFVGKISSSGNWQWVQTGGSSANDAAIRLDYAGNGSVVTGGSYRGQATFGNTNLSHWQDKEAFVAKVDSNGWIFAKGGTGNGDNQVSSVKVDSSGDIYYMTKFTGNLTMSTGFSSTYSSTAVVGKISGSSFQYLWHNTTSSTGAVNPINLALTANGDLAVVGDYDGTVYFGNGQQFTRSGTGQNGYVQGFNASNGHTKYAFTIGNGGTGDDIVVNDLAFDPGAGGATGGSSAYNTLILAGYFKGTATFGPGDSLTSAGNEDGFLAKVKFTEEGCYINGSNNYNTPSHWEFCSGSSDSVSALDVVVDSSGNSYYTGYFSGTAVIGSSILTSSGDKDIFVAKLNSSGSWQWVISAGGSGPDVGNAISLHSASSQIYVTGAFRGVATFGTSTLNSGGTNIQDIFVAKLSSSGSWQWVESAGGSYSDEGRDIVVDSTGWAYVTGHFQSPSTSSATFGTHSITSAGANDIFVAKISPTGSWGCAVRAGGSSWDAGRGIALGNSGNVYVTGGFEGTATFGSSTSLTSSGQSDIFIAKLSSSCTWQSAFKEGGSGGDGGNDITLDSSNKIYVTGYFGSTVNFGNSVSLTSSGVEDIFVWKLDQSNNPPSTSWAVKAGSSSSDYGRSLAVDSSGHVYLVGHFQGNPTFGNLSTISSTGSYDIFFAQISNSGIWTTRYYWGSSGSDSGNGFALDSSGSNVYFAGKVSSGTVYGDNEYICGVNSCGIFVKFVTPSVPLAIETTSLPNAEVGTGYSYIVNASGGTGNYTWTVTSGSVPGINLISWGLFTGTPTAAGTYQVTIQVSDGTSTVTKTLSLLVNAASGNDVTIVGKTSNVTAGGYHSCAILDTGKAKCWGSGNNGQIGDGDNNGHSSPVDVSLDASTTLVDISAAYRYTCAVDQDGAVLCWGQNDYGQLGDGTNTSSNVPLKMSASSFDEKVVAISAGRFHACAIDETGTAYCWGNNNNGKLGIGSTTSSYTPQKLTFSSPVLDISAGEYHSCAILSNDDLYCWGRNLNGQLGDGTKTERHSPVKVDLSDEVPTEVSVGQKHTCVNTESDKTFCWGHPTYDGNSTTTTGTSIMGVDDDSVDGLVSINSGNHGSCSLTDTGEVDCWGEGLYGQLGDGTNDDSDTPVSTLITGVVEIAVGTRHACSIDSDGDLGCWGRGSGGQLGDGTTDDSNTTVWESTGSVWRHADGPAIFNSTADWTSSNSLLTRSVVWGDVDGDGDLDLAVGNYNGNNEVYFNSGTALAATPAWTSSNSLYTESVAWGDVDGDGDLDLAVGNYGSTNEVYLNSGTALATTPAWTSSNSLNSISVAWGDVDGDGDLDLAVGNMGGNNEVYLNSGTALATTPAWSISNSQGSYSVAWGDMDGDGDLDLAVGNYNGNNEVYFNSGTALAATPAWTSSNSLNTHSVAWGDLDGDGDLDLAVGGGGSGYDKVYLNSGTALATTPAWTSSSNLDTRSIVWGDVDGDGDLDLAVGNHNGNNEVYFNSGTALAATPAWTSSNSLNTRTIAFGDVDGDGDLDLAVGNNIDINEVYLNQLNDGGAGADGLPDIDIGGPSDSDSGGKNLATGYSHNCAIQKNQTISCWGSNQYGQLGSEQYDFYEYNSPLYDVDLPQGTVPISVTAGEYFTCAILSGSSTDVYCWGRGEYGRLGNGDDSDSSIPEDKVELPGGAYPVDVSSGFQHSCLVSQDGDVYCWGSNSHGQLGNGTSGGYSSTAGIVNGPNVDYTSVAVGEHHSCALTTEDDLYCWGNNGQGQLGDGTWSSSATPVLVSGSITWKSVVPNGMASHSCAISSSDELYCWGSNGNGQLGDGSYSNANTPQVVQLQSSSTNKAVDASVGRFGTSCAVLEDSSTYCWGINARGYLGDGTWQDSTTPVSVSLPEGSEVLEISSGIEHSCVLLASDQIMCWGFGNWGLIGNGKSDDTGHPNYVSGEREWNGLGKEFYHLPTSVSIGTDNSVPKLESSVSFTSLPTSLNVDISSRVYFSHGQQILLFSPTEVEQNQPVNGLSWANEYSFHDELPSITGNGNDYCIEIHLNSNLTGDSIGYGLDCVWYNPPSSQDDFAPDDFEDVWGTSTNTQDSDGDGYEDWFEYWFGGDPLDSEVKPSDADMDGLPDALELAINSDENSADTDGDGHEDIDELIYGGHPLKPWTAPSNGDYDDCYDVWENWNGLNASNSDTDGDGVIDCLDTDSLDPDNTPVDSDGDGMPDDMEEEFGSDPDNWDSDGDGMPDSFEYIMDTDPNSDQSWYSDWAIAWENKITNGPNVSISASSSKENHPASLAIDTGDSSNSNYDTYWQSDGACPATLEIDLGRAQYFSHLDFQIKVLEPGNHPINYSIEYRASNSDSWTNYASWSRYGQEQPTDFWDGVGTELPLSKARYVRLNCSDSTDNSGTSHEIAISVFQIWGVKNLQYINPDGGSGGGAGQPSVEAFLNIDPANQTLTAGYSAQLNGGLDYDIEWRLIEADQGGCLDVPLSIDQGTVNLMSWDTAYNGTFQQIPVDYSTISDWYDEFCLELDLMQGGNSLDVDSLFIDATAGGNNEDFITIRYYANYKGWAHESGSHYDVIVVEQAFSNCLLDDGGITDTEDIAHAVACHYLFGHPNSNWGSTYSPSANDPWVGSYFRSDGEIRPFLLSEMSGLPQYESGWGLFIPEDQINQISESSTGLDLPILDFLTNTSNYVTFTFEYSNSDGSNNGGNGSNQTQTDTDGDGVDDLFDLCAGTAPGVQVDSTGCPIGDPTTHNTTISVEFIEQKVDGVWNQNIELLIEDPWRGYNHSLSFKLEDTNGNTLYSYFSPIDEDAQDGWWILFTDSDEDEIEWKLDLNWEGVLEGGYWQSSSRFFEDVEYPYFEAGEYCVEVSLGYQINASDTAMSAVKNLIDKLQFCGTFEHDSMDGVSWDGVVEPEQGLIDKVASNAIVSAVMDFMNSTTGQIVSILLGVLAFAGRMVLARGQRAKNKRVRKLAQRIRRAETIGRLKIIEMDVEKANDKNKLPRGGYGDLMEQIEAQMEKLGFDGNPQDGGTSGDWSSDEGANEWQDDFQQAADMMWEAQDMMAEAKEEAAMARQAIEDMQQQMGNTPQRASPKQEPEPEEAFSSRYVTSGIDSSAAGAAGPSLPSARIMDLDGDGVVSPEEKEIWNAMTQEERAEFFSPITNIAEEIRRRQILNEKREKMNKKRGGGKKDKKRKKKDKKW